MDIGIGERDVIDERAILDLDALLVHSPLVLVAFDREYRLSYWSARARDAFGWEPADVLGKRLEETQLIHPDDLTEVLRIEKRVRNRPADAMVIVNRMLHRNGTVRTFRWSTGRPAKRRPLRRHPRRRGHQRNRRGAGRPG